MSKLTLTSRVVAIDARGAPSLGDMVTYAAVFALLLAYIALVAAYCALRTLAKLRRDTHVLSRGTRGPHGEQSLIQATTRYAGLTASVAEQLEALRAHVDNSQTALRAHVDSTQTALRAHVDNSQTALRAHVDSTRQDALAALAERSSAESGALRRVALVRYDAFSELSGRTSFSLAVLDDRGDGVTISAIAGRSDTRVYAKAIAAGEGEHELSPEERQAVSTALGAAARRFRKAG